MIVTKKAAVGFLLLAVIVFFSAQYTVYQMDAYQRLPKVDNFEKVKVIDKSITKTETPTYRPPILNLGNNAPLVITIVMELFALVCYLALKKYEPAINRAAEDFVEATRPKE